MIAVIIIGLLAATAIPAFMRVRQKSQNTRFISDLRTFAHAFENFALQNGSWPVTTAPGAVPDGMSGDLNPTAWLTSRNSIGGQWGWLKDTDDLTAALVTTNVTAGEAQMTAIDAMLDDGNLESGNFRKMGQRYAFALER